MNDDYALRLAELRTRFVARAENDRHALTAALDGGDLEEARRLCHGLAGIAGTFGFAEIGNSAYALEQTAEDGYPKSQRDEAWARLDRLLGQVVDNPQRP